MYKHHNIKLVLNAREHIVKKQSLTLYSYDINNSVIQIKVVDPCDDIIKLSNYNVEIISVFKKSNKKWSYTPAIEDDKIIFKFDTTLIDKDEDVICHVYINKTYDDGSIGSADVAVFEFKVRLSIKHQELQEKYVKDKKPDFVFNQVFSSNEWHIVHNLNKIPQVTILDTSLKQHFGAVQHINNNELIIRFSVPFMGQAQLD